MNQIKIPSQSKEASDIASLIDFTGVTAGQIPFFDNTNGINHLKFGKVIKDATNGFVIYDDSGIQLFRVDNTRRVIIGDGTVGSIGITSGGLQILTASGWVYDSSITFIDTGWLNLTLQNGWSAYGSGYPAPQYRKSGNLVTLRGKMKTGSINNGTLIFTLPTGFTPTYPMDRIVSDSSNSWRARLVIATNGQVTLQDFNDNGWFSIDGISFYID